MRNNNPTINGFRFAMGDVNYLDYGATWMRHAGKQEYHFIALLNWEDSVGEREAKEIGERYNLQLSIVDLAQIDEVQQKKALESCCQPGETRPEWIAYACMEHGLKAPVRDVNTSNFRKTFAALAAESRAISRDKNARRRALSKRVNGLGSTAAEFMRGDLNKALVRGVIKGDPKALLMAKNRGRQLRQTGVVCGTPNGGARNGGL